MLTSFSPAARKWTLRVESDPKMDRTFTDEDAAIDAYLRDSTKVECELFLTMPVSFSIQRLVLALVRRAPEGKITTDAIRERLPDINPATVYNTLGYLCRRKKIRHFGYGVYGRID